MLKHHMGHSNDFTLFFWQPLSLWMVELFSVQGLSSGWPDPDPWGEPHHAEVLECHPTWWITPCDLTITANHQHSLSGTVMIGNDSGLKYSDDGWRLMPGPKRAWARLYRGRTQWLLTALVGRVAVNIFIIMKCGYLTLEYVGSLSTLTLMFKVTSSGRRPHIGSSFCQMIC